MAGEMIPYDTAIGDFRVHYAGFFDPGFGDPNGSFAVLIFLSGVLALRVFCFFFDVIGTDLKKMEPFVFVLVAVFALRNS